MNNKRNIRAAPGLGGEVQWIDCAQLIDTFALKLTLVPVAPKEATLPHGRHLILVSCCLDCDS